MINYQAISEEIKKNVRAVLTQEDIMNDVYYYLFENPKERYVYARVFKREFRLLINSLLEGIEEDEEEGNF